MEWVRISGVCGWGFGVEDLGFNLRAQSSGFGVPGFGSRASGGFGLWALGFQRLGAFGLEG